MLEREFDQFAREYEGMLGQAVSTSGEDARFFASYKPADVHRHLLSAGSEVRGLRVLDFGCGVGLSLSYLGQEFPDADLYGADISRKSLEFANGADCASCLVQFHPELPLPFSDRQFDLIFVACVFHHIPQPEHHRVLAELHRITRPGGWLFLFEHNPLNPVTRHVVNTCAFDENAVLIRGTEMRRRIEGSGFARAVIRYRIFFPRLLRKLRCLELFLTWCPLGAQYYVAARRDDDH